MVGSERGEFVYAPPAMRQDNVVRPSEEEAHHLFRVRRVTPGATVWVTDGEGLVHCCICAADRTLIIRETRREYGELPRHITLCVSALKGDRNREIVNTAVQMGVQRIAFFAAERSEGRVDEEGVLKLRRRAVAAIKQCGRARLPELKPYPSLDAVLRDLPRGVAGFVAHPTRALRDLALFPPEMDEIALLVGPEGGLTDVELAAAFQNGLLPVSLGQRRLRAETAVAAGLSYLLFRCGE